MGERQIEVESGKWRWSITRLGRAKRPSVSGFFRPPGEADPDPDAEGPLGDAELPVLLLEDPEDTAHLMSATLSDDVGEDDVSEEELLILARDPDWRQLTDPDGRIWRIERVEKPAAVMEEAEFERSADHVRISIEGGPERVVPLPEGRLLGMLRREELLKLVEGDSTDG